MKRIPAPSRARPALTRERIAATALALIDEAGLDGLSMRVLGNRLGVEAMALYHHFPDKHQLLDAVGDALVAQWELPARGTRPPLARLRHLVRSGRASALRHPQAFALVTSRRLNTPRSMEMLERVLEAFADLGLEPGESARWLSLMGAFASGHAMAEVAPGSPGGQPDALPGPYWQAAAPHLQPDQLDAVFESGLEVLFDALAARLIGPPTR
ncbi:MAG TPA: TetR family transcriptional regulator [Burkholderiaceae bacterium]|jgi:AcrR family transcriptional regulator|nr:TetR family transcriptional regulator [Burkholderiaceae bacterium]